MQKQIYSNLAKYSCEPPILTGFSSLHGLTAMEMLKLDSRLRGNDEMAYYAWKQSWYSVYIVLCVLCGNFLYAHARRSCNGPVEQGVNNFSITLLFWLDSRLRGNDDMTFLLGSDSCISIIFFSVFSVFSVAIFYSFLRALASLRETSCLTPSAMASSLACPAITAPCMKPSRAASSAWR